MIESTNTLLSMSSVTDDSENVAPKQGLCSVFTEGQMRQSSDPFLPWAGIREPFPAVWCVAGSERLWCKAPLEERA